MNETCGPARNRFVFVAGLHRTGTSLLTSLLAQHPAISTISGSPVPENEGCYLQGAIPHTALHGRPGHYATDPAQHLVESGPFDNLPTRDRMLADWSRWFDPQAAWWLEKSPVNLIRMRLYQQLFPTCQFVVILRHPEKMAAALAKWCDRPAAELIDYALAAYRIMLEDFSRLHWAVVIRYEDLVADPRRYAAALFRFLDLPDNPVAMTIRDGNADYPDCARMSDRQAAQSAVFGYGKGGKVLGFDPLLHHPQRAIREDVGRILVSGNGTA